MVQLLNAFNPMDFDPSQGGGALPLGKHPVIIESAEVKPTKDNSGGYLQFNLRITDGPAAGTTGAYRLNLYNQSQDAANIAHRQLSAICHVTQTFQLGQDGTQIQVLFNKPFVIEVGMQKGEEAQAKGYTEIKRVFDMAGNEPGKSGAAGGGQQTPQGFGNGQGQQQGQGQAQGQQNAGSGQQGAQAWGGQQNAGQGQPQGQQASAQGGNGGAAWGQGGGQQANSQAQGQGQAQGGGQWSQQQGGNGGGEAKPAWGQR